SSATAAAAAEMPCVTDVDRCLADLDRDGYTLIPDFLSAAQLASMRAAVTPMLGQYNGRNDFEGESTERIYSIAARHPVFADLACDQRMLALCDAVLQPGYLLTGSQSINIHPGESPQPFHADDSFYPIARPRPMVSIAIIVAIDSF